MPQPFVQKPDLPDITDDRFTQAFQVTQDVAKEILDTSATLRAVSETQRQVGLGAIQARRAAERKDYGNGQNGFAALAELGGQIASGVTLMREIDLQNRQLELAEAEHVEKYNRKVAERIYSAANIQVQDLLLKSQSLVRQYGLEQGNYITQQRINSLLDTPEWQSVAQNYPDLAVKLRGVYQNELKSLETQQTEQHISAIEDSRKTQVGFHRHNFRGLVSNVIGTSPFINDPSDAIQQFNREANKYFADNNITDIKTKLDIISPAMDALVSKLERNYANDAQAQQTAFRWQTLTNEIAEFQALVDAGVTTEDGRRLTQIDLENFKAQRAQALGIPGAAEQVVADRAAILKYDLEQSDRENRLENLITDGLDRADGLVGEVADTAKMFTIGSSLHRAINNDPLEIERIKKMKRNPGSTASFMLSVPDLLEDLRNDVTTYKGLRNQYLKLEQDLLVMKGKAAPSPDRVVISNSDEFGGRRPTFERVTPGTADRPSPTATPEQIQNLEKQLEARQFDMDSLVEKWSPYGINVADPRDESMLQKMGMTSEPVFEQSLGFESSVKITGDTYRINRNPKPHRLSGISVVPSVTAFPTGVQPLVETEDVNTLGKPPPLNPTAAVRNVPSREPNRPVSFNAKKPGVPLVKPLRKSSTGILPAHENGAEVVSFDNVSVVSGNTGIGTGAHLDLRIKRNGQYIKPNSSHFAQVTVSGKPLTSYRVTSGYGKRKAPVAGASTFHRGVDFGIASGSKIEIADAEFLRYRPPESTGGGGWVAEYRLKSGEIMQLLHLSPPAESAVGEGAELTLSSGKRMSAATVLGGTVMAVNKKDDGYEVRIATPSGTVETFRGLRGATVRTGQVISPGLGIGTSDRLRFSVSKGGQLMNARAYLNQSSRFHRQERDRGLGARPKHGDGVVRIGAKELSPGVYQMPSGRVYNLNTMRLHGGRSTTRYVPEGRTFSERNPVKTQRASIQASAYPKKNDPTHNYGYEVLAQDKEAAKALAEISDTLGIPAQFLADIIAHESRWGATTENSLGYYGLIQFGSAALKDIGLTKASLPKDRATQLRRAVLPYLQKTLQYARASNPGAGYNTIEDVLAAIWGGGGFLGRRNRPAGYSDGWITWKEYLGRLGRDVGRSYAHSFR